METTFKFSHDEDALDKALGISDGVEKKCTEIILFSAFSNHLLGRELFDQEDEAPRSLKTKTGDLEKSISLCSNEQEKEYLLLMFHQLHTMAMESIAKYIMLNKINGPEKKKLSLMLELIEMKISEKAEEEKADFIKPSEMFNRIEFVKQSRYNFDKYLQLLGDSSKSIINKFYTEE